MLDLMVLAQNGGGGGGGFFMALILAMVVYMLIMASYQRKGSKQVKQMLANLKKNDRVMTIGGIIGSVVSVTPDEVVLKVDESQNVKITVIRSAIKQVLTEDSKPGESGQQ